jgi:hypothetical protein
MSSDNSENVEATKFDGVMRKILSVSKEELKKREKGLFTIMLVTALRPGDSIWLASELGNANPLSDDLPERLRA